jgi:hypothetical protein
MLLFGRLFGQRLEEGGRKSGMACLLLAALDPTLLFISCDLLNLALPTTITPVHPLS